MNELKTEFIENIKKMLGDEAEAFFDALEKNSALALRINPFRENAEALANEFIQSPVPWEKNGFYLKENTRPGLSMLHAAGAYYLQEASAMLPATLLGVKEGETVLDLCAAPGGKSGQLAAALKRTGVLVSNEPDHKRAKMLAGNLERLGVTNAVVTSEYPDKLAENFVECFDRILVDAPCSGEGMFRRDPASRDEWQPNSPYGCAERQKEILTQAAKMLKKGGTLVYSTCTYNETEDEDIAKWFLDSHPEFEFLDFEVPAVGTSRNGMIKILPHRVNGDGQFAFRCVKTLSTAPEQKKSKEKREKTDKTAHHELFDAFKKEFSFDLPNVKPVLIGNALWALPENTPHLGGLNVVAYGLQLAVALKNRLEPAHAYAMSGLCENSFDTDEAAAVKYLRGEEIPCDKKSWTVVTYKSMPLGFGKASGGTLKNHLPKGLRLH